MNAAHEPPSEHQVRLNLVFATMTAYALPLEAFFHYGFGERHRRRGVFPVFAMFLHFVVLCAYDGGRSLRPPSRPEAMYAFVLVYAAFLGGKRNVDPRQHSYYTGQPRLRAWLAGSRWQPSEHFCKRFLEPSLALVAGTLLIAADFGVGSFVVLGAFSMAALNDLGARQDREKRLDLHDATVEQNGLLGDAGARPVNADTVRVAPKRTTAASDSKELKRIRARLDPALRQLLDGPVKEDDAHEA